MSRCPDKCQTCHQEVNAERREKVTQARAEVEHIRKVRAGPFPTLAPESEPEPEFEMDSEGDSETSETEASEDVFEEGDHLFYMRCLPKLNSSEPLRPLRID